MEDADLRARLAAYRRGGGGASVQGAAGLERKIPYPIFLVFLFVFLLFVWMRVLFS
jgi:hypothetical protein